eukprot:scaffold3340_cov255-Pinguiococcus_pyrenoidosus.AAC.13
MLFAFWRAGAMPRSLPSDGVYGHLLGSLQRLVTSDEAICLPVAHASPGRRQLLARHEGSFCLRHGLHAPVARGVLVEHVLQQLLLRVRCALLGLQLEEVRLPRAGRFQLDDLARGVHVEALLHRRAYDAPRRPPGVHEALHDGHELLASEHHGLLERRIGGGLGAVLVPARIQCAHPLGKRGAHHVVQLPIGHLDPIVNPVNVLHELAIDALVEKLQQPLGVVQHALAAAVGHLGQHLSPEVLVDQPRRAQLGRKGLQDAIEAPLVMIEAQAVRVVLRAHVHHQLAAAQLIAGARAQDLVLLEARQHLQHGDGQRLVAVEAARVRADEFGAVHRGGHYAQTV